jgi:hypothetical protein
VQAQLLLNARQAVTDVATLRMGSSRFVGKADNVALDGRKPVLDTPQATFDATQQKQQIRRFIHGALFHSRIAGASQVVNSTPAGSKAAAVV